MSFILRRRGGRFFKKLPDGPERLVDAGEAILANLAFHLAEEDFVEGPTGVFHRREVAEHLGTKFIKLGEDSVLVWQGG